MREYETMLFFRPCRHDAVRRKRVEPPKQKTMYVLDVRRFYGQVGSAACFNLVAKLENACT